MQISERPIVFRQFLSCCYEVPGAPVLENVRDILDLFLLGEKYNVEAVRRQSAQALHCRDFSDADIVSAFQWLQTVQLQSEEFDELREHLVSALVEKSRASSSDVSSPPTILTHSEDLRKLILWFLGITSTFSSLRELHDICAHRFVYGMKTTQNVMMGLQWLETVQQRNEAFQTFRDRVMTKLVQRLKNRTADVANLFNSASNLLKLSIWVYQNKRSHPKCQDLQDICASRFADAIQDICASPALAELNVTDVILLFNNPYLTEDQILDLALAWLQLKSKESAFLSTMQHSIMSQVRFPLLSPQRLVSLSQHVSLGPECQERYVAALSWQLGGSKKDLEDAKLSSEMHYRSRYGKFCRL